MSCSTVLHLYINATLILYMYGWRDIGFPIGEKIVKNLFHKKIIVVFRFSYPSKLYLCGVRKELEKCKKKCKQRMTA